MGRIAADLGCSSFLEESKVRKLFAGGRWVQPSVPQLGKHFFETTPEPGN